MITYSNTEPQPITIEKRQVRVTWNARQETVDTYNKYTQGDYKTETQWVYNEAIFDVYDTREVIIRKIIASVYSLEDELALINNRDDKPEEYVAYQQLRSDAKQLADDYLATRQANG